MEFGIESTISIENIEITKCQQNEATRWFIIGMENAASFLLNVANISADFCSVASPNQSPSSTPQLFAFAYQALPLNGLPSQSFPTSLSFQNISSHCFFGQVVDISGLQQQKQDNHQNEITLANSIAPLEAIVLNVTLDQGGMISMDWSSYGQGTTTEGMIMVLIADVQVTGAQTGKDQNNDAAALSVQLASNITGSQLNIAEVKVQDYATTGAAVMVAVLFEGHGRMPITLAGLHMRNLTGGQAPLFITSEGASISVSQLDIALCDGSLSQGLFLSSIHTALSLSNSSLLSYRPAPSSHQVQDSSLLHHHRNGNNRNNKQNDNRNNKQNDNRNNKQNDNRNLNKKHNNDTEDDHVGVISCTNTGVSGEKGRLASITIAGDNRFSHGDKRYVSGPGPHHLPRCSVRCESGLTTPVCCTPKEIRKLFCTTYTLPWWLWLTFALLAALILFAAVSLLLWLSRSSSSSSSHPYLPLDDQVSDLHHVN